jgi:hypothetical protein
MSKMNLSMVVLSALVGASALSAVPAHAHINMDGVLKDRGGNQKTPNCGGVPRSAKPYEFEPGATIALGVDEFVYHDGYFRISFDDDGEDGFKDPQSIDPLNPNRYGPGKKCQGTAADRCGKSDFCSVVSEDGPTVLWDNLDPHVTPTGVGSKKWAWTVTLPNIECENCTIQVMQVMEDPVGDAHGPFDGKSDLYYKCIDVKLKKGVGKTPGTVDTVPSNKGIDCLKAKPSDGATSEADGGVATSSDAGKPISARRDAGTMAYEFGDGGRHRDDEHEDDEAAVGEAGGCSVGASTRGAWSHGALALLMGGALVLRNRRRRTR